LSYFVRHPSAVDDIEGVTRWRLAEEVVQFHLAETQRALDALVKRRLLLCRTVEGGAALYGLGRPAAVARRSTVRRAVRRGGR
jgi:hypothetical protein